MRPVANGGSVDVQGPAFAAGVVVDLITALPASARVRFELPPGTRWGPDAPDPSEQCTSTAASGECNTGMLEPIITRNSVGWAWDIVADQPGSYVLRAAIVEASEKDPDLSNNTVSVTVVVTGASSGGGGGSSGSGGTGDTAAAKASAVTLSPARPRAGSTVVASVRVTRGGSAVRPTGVTCTGSIGKTKVKGGARAASGVASCLFKTPKTAKGKALAGSVSFRAGGSAFTKRFATTLR
jgi:hypothetical protein